MERKPRLEWEFNGQGEYRARFVIGQVAFLATVAFNSHKNNVEPRKRWLIPSLALFSTKTYKTVLAAQLAAEDALIVALDASLKIVSLERELAESEGR